jgi:Kef-type K+ transport system membrane component KefB
MNKQAIIIFCSVLVICTTGVISMTCEMCVINKQHGKKNIITLTQCITISSTALVCCVIADALRRLNKRKGKLIISTKNLFI